MLVAPDVTVTPAVSPAATRCGLLIVAAITLAAFGPYLAPGLRTEQVAVYGSAAMLGALGLWLRPRFTGTAVWVLGAHLSLIGVAMIGLVFPPPNFTLHEAGDLVAGLDNLILPFAVVAVVAMLVGVGADPARMLRAVCTVTVLAMALNAIIAITSAAGVENDLLAQFRGYGEAESVADRAEQLGRYSGIFNQPAEAGVLYSMAVLAALYLYQRHVAKLAAVLLILTVGGVLSVSKIFLLAGVPVGIAYALLAHGRGRRMVALGAASAGAWFAADIYLDQWRGQRFAQRLIPGSGGGDQLDTYTAGRVGGDSTLQQAVDLVMSLSPASGMGPAGLRVAYDNGWVEALIVAGIVGVILHTAVLASLTVGWWRARSHRPESPFTGALLLLLIGASTGLPALTANRCATVVWLLLTLLLLARTDGRVGTWWQNPSQGQHRRLALAPTLVRADR
ncbi:hypothetical protein NIE79_003422 [Micromonospora sp. NIE79]|uniref:O-antigen ligase domain-containing protein n=1 Tax=Micromonospora trifolii TaxID=2911208 RepID=A0ABS9N4U3_9ACTN|nr:hypothetical protein [Micromonospora trifolii]MCG5444979.1 hypothetical protein [Micromonospora trifolii]